MNQIGKMVSDLLDRSEEFKKKWLLLEKEDLFERLLLRDKMKEEAGKLRQQFILDKLEMDKDKACKVIEYKAVTDDKGKGLTEKIIEANIKQDFYDKEIELATLKAMADLLYERAESIIDFVNIVKIELKSKIEL